MTKQVFCIGLTFDESRLPSDKPTFSNADIYRYTEALRELAGNGVTYIDVFTILNTSTDLIDGLHPNAAGYEKLFATIRDHVRLTV